jgi:uncharacterized protein YabE (DUF348 family)
VSFRQTLRSAVTLPASSSSEAPSSRVGSALAVLRQPTALVLQALLLVALLAGTMAWTMTGKTVELALDGEVTTVDFRGDTVADALAAADLTVGEHDALVPSADTEVEDGDRVALRRGRQLELVVDGVSKTVWVTALDVDEALQELNLREEGLVLSASRSRGIPLDGLALEVRTPKAFTVAVDGTEVSLESAGPTVADALAEASIVPGPLDRVTPAPSEAVTEGLRVVVNRVSSSKETTEVAIPFGTERRDDATLTKGTTKELQAGTTGLVRRTAETVVVDGTVESKAVVAEQRLREPVSRVLAVGTKPAPKPAAAAPAPAGGSGPRQSTGGADSLNWGALAQCESGGNPRIVSSNGLYHGLYQFSTSTWRSVGGSGTASQASPDEQTYRAKLLYNRSGAGQWPTCGRRLFG